MIRAATFAALSAFSGQTVAASDRVFVPATVDFDPVIALECLDRGVQQACFGAAADNCIRQVGPSTPTIEACLQEEYLFWDALLDRAHARHLDRAQSIDEETQFSDPDAPSRSEPFEQAHAAWLEFRARHCDYVSASWRGGSGAGATEFRCLMELTGSYALHLQPDIWKHAE